MERQQHHQRMMRGIFGLQQQPQQQQQVNQPQQIPSPPTSNKLPVHKVQAPSKDLIEECAICTEEFNKRCDDVAYIDCMHWYHRKCIEEWLQRKNECVVCRQETATIFKTK